MDIKSNNKQIMGKVMIIMFDGLGVTEREKNLEAFVQLLRKPITIILFVQIHCNNFLLQ
jgi:hypothetical protein